MSRQIIAMRMTEAVGYIEHCMEAARTQVQHGQWFAFEHTESSSAWQLPCVQAVRQMAGVLEVTFDQCMVGLVSRVSELPMLKRTRIVTNSAKLVLSLKGRLCDGSHYHQIIQGTEGGVLRSVHAQCYPLPLVTIIVAAACNP